MKVNDSTTVGTPAGAEVRKSGDALGQLFSEQVSAPSATQRG
jgi:hypothetical protein